MARPYSQFNPAILALVLGLGGGLSGCGFWNTVGCRGLHNVFKAQCRKPGAKGADDGELGSVSSAGGTTTVATPAAGAAFALTRIQPEQLSNDVELTTGFGAQFRVTNSDIGRTLDYLVLAYGVPLGGLDFQAASKRDPSTKAQTLLVARVLASQLGAAAVFTEIDKDPAARTLFTKCDLKNDRPFMDVDKGRPLDQQLAVQTGETRWSEQVDDLFWRFYSRPPTGTERAAVRTAFVKTIEADGYPPAGWVTVLYALMATEEFWHR